MKHREMSLTISHRQLNPAQQALSQSLRHLFSPSGGLSYHLSALRYRRLWKPFLRNVERWLSGWKTSEKKLMIFGASAGWTLPASFLERFESILVVEPDPLARALLRRRFPQVRNWDLNGDSHLLPWTSDRAGRFGEFLMSHPDHAVLFSNLLGQVPLIWPRELSDDEWKEKNAEFLAALENHNWASYHDILSAHRKPVLTSAATPLLEMETNLNRLALRVWGSSPSGSSAKPVVDHGTEWLAPQAYGLWQLRPNTYHLIGFMQAASAT